MRESMTRRPEARRKAPIRDGLGTGGIGQAALQGRECALLVERALRAGYRCVDTQPGPGPYGNEEAVAEGMKASGVPREEIFLIVKILPTAHGEREAMAALDASLARLGTDYADLVLVMWPGHWDPNQRHWSAKAVLLDDREAPPPPPLPAALATHTCVSFL